MAETERRASLRTRALLLVIATTVALVAALYLPLRELLLGSFIRLEDQTVARNVERAQSALAGDVSQLAATCRDYAVWDDTYAFAGGEAPDYPAANLMNETFEHNRLGLVALVGSEGEARFVRRFDLIAGRAEPGELPPGVRELCADAPASCEVSGLVRTPAGPMLVAAHPVLTSNEGGPPRGALIVGRPLDDREVARLASAIGLSLTIEPTEGPLGADDRVEHIDGERVAGLAPVDDVGGVQRWVVRVEMARDIYAHGVLSARWIALAVAIAGVILGLLILLLLDRVVLRRVARLSSDVRRVSSSTLAASVEVRGHDELAGLAVSINGMLRDLATAREVLRSAFGRYVSEEVAREILSRPEGAELGGQTREVTILFSDIRRYSTISEHLPPTDVVELLNEHFGAMSEVIERHRGCVIEFLGDAILAVFGAPLEMADHAERATRAAIEMQERSEALNLAWQESGKAKLWQDRGIVELSSRIGLHTGRVVVGNLGSRSRMKYAVIGDSVNTAARVEALNDELGTDVLLTAEVRARLGPELAARMQDRGEHAVKGRDRKVHVYAPSSS